jgi:signal transduction histidine kinase
MRTGPRAAVALGTVCAAALLLSPAVAPAADAVLPGVLPLSFFAAGAVAQVLRPAHPAGDRLLAVGVLHLVAMAGAVAATLSNAAWFALPVTWLSVTCYALGFVALLDLLARYPTGGYAWAWVGRAVRACAVLAVVLVVPAVMGSAEIPSVLELDTAHNPIHVPALAPLAPAITGLALLPVAGLALLLARYRGAPALDRSQMRWPIVTAAVLAVGLLTTGLAEEVLGPQVQAALFLAAAAALPMSFLIGLLRHSEQAERLAEVEASRARLADVADAERRRIERDLHDGAQQSILALLARVELVRARLGDSAELDDELRGIGADLRTVHRELRELARGVHPAVLSDHGLAEAVRSAMTRLPGTAELVVAPELSGVRFPATVEAAAYFTVLEGLANALKHAGSTSAVVTLAAEGDVLEVSVSDSGTGFGPEDGRGAGLTGLADRLAAVGGRLVVESVPGTGTTLRGLLPARGHVT